MKVRLVITWRSIQKPTSHGLFPSAEEAKVHARDLEQRHLRSIRSGRIEDPKTGEVLEEIPLGTPQRSYS